VQHADKQELGQPCTKMSAPGEDDAAELYKNGGEKVQDKLLNNCNVVLISGQVPQIWNDAIIVPIFKKGDSRMAANYRRGIFLKE